MQKNKSKHIGKVVIYNYYYEEKRMLLAVDLKMLQIGCCPFLEGMQKWDYITGGFDRSI